MDERMENTFTAIALIQQKFEKDKKRLGKIKCPICGKNLSYSIAELNNHIWGNCETKKCLTWMM